MIDRYTFRESLSPDYQKKFDQLEVQMKVLMVQAIDELKVQSIGDYKSKVIMKGWSNFVHYCSGVSRMAISSVYLPLLETMKAMDSSVFKEGSEMDRIRLFWVGEINMFSIDMVMLVQKFWKNPEDKR